MTDTFQHTQRAFAAWIRDPDNQPQPAGIEARRLAIYRDLVYNNIDGFLRNGFPVLHTLVDGALWPRLVRAFIADHACHSPYFAEISGHFVEFLQGRADWLAQLPPWALELAHYEWMEVVMDMAERPALPDGLDPNGDLLNDAPVLSPLVSVLGYQWPVHQLSESFRPAQAPAEPTWLVVYRNASDDVKFMEINRATAALLQSLQQAPGQSGATCLRQLAPVLGMAEQVILPFGAELLEQLRARGMVLGSCAAAA